MSVSVLLIAPLPPPLGGDTVTSKRLLESAYWKEAGYDIECIDTSPGEGVRTTEIRRTWKDSLRAARIVTRLVPALRRADIALLWANSSFIVSLGIPVMRLIRLSGIPCIVKPFGSMLAERLRETDPLRKRQAVSLLNSARSYFPRRGC